MSPTLAGLNPLSLTPRSNPDLGGFFGQGQAAELLGSPAAAAAAAAEGAFGGLGALMGGYDSVHSSSSANVVSGSGFAGLGGGVVGGVGVGIGGNPLLSPENSSYLAEAAQYAHDGMDVPGTAQVGEM